MSGFSIVETVTVLAITLIVSTVAVPNVRTALRQARVDNAYQTVLQHSRRARQMANDMRQVHRLSLISPRTVQVERVNPDSSLTMVLQAQLPSDLEFRMESGIPIALNDTPDRFGVSAAINFNSTNRIFFQPDGTAWDASNQLSNGIVYMARPGELASARAVTLYGATGRLKGWTLVRQSSSWVWQ